MRAFEVYRNDKKLCLAGIGNDGVLTAEVFWVTRKGRGDLLLHVGGLVSPRVEHVSWVDHRPVRVGDSIEIRVVEANSVDKPREKHRPDPAQELREQKHYVRKMTKQLGWKIQARPKQSV